MSDAVNPLGIWEPFPVRVKVKVEERAGGRRARVRDITGSMGRSLAGGRASVDNPNQMLMGAVGYFSPISSDEYWRNHQLDSKTLDRVSSTKLMELLADLSPDVSRALWDFILLCCPGYEATAFKPGTEAQDKTAQAALDSFLSNLHGPYNVPNVIPPKVIIGTMFMSAFLRGAICAELVLDKTGRMPLEIAVPDPAYLTFKKIPDEERGYVWQMGQWQLGKFVVLDRPTIGYVPIHPFLGNPKGRPMATPAIFTTLFLIGLLHDLRRVIAQQGYPRHDIVLLLEKLLAAMPEEDRNDPEEQKKWVDDAIAEVEEILAALEPDEAFVHTDVFEMKDPKGVIDARSLGAVEGIIKALERMAVRALKSFPLAFGINEGTSETHANRQWEMLVAGIKSIQQLCETLLERLLTIALQVQGIAATVQVRFAELRAAELLRDAQVELLRATIARMKYDNGWTTQDEAALEGAGKAKAAEKEPRSAPKSNGATGPVAGAQADPGSERSSSSGRQNGKRTLTEDLMAVIQKHAGIANIEGVQ